MMISEIMMDSFIVTTEMPLSAVEKLYIHHVIAKTGNNISKAARILKIDRRTLYRKLEQIGD